MRGNKKHTPYKFYSLATIIVGIFLLSLLWKFSLAVRTISVFAIVIAFYFLDKGFNIGFNKSHYFFVILISVLSFWFSPLYFIYPEYDKLQHFFQPILVASIIFFIVSKIKIELKWKLLLTFLIVISLSGIFEIIEYVLDIFLDTKLQGVFLRDLSGLDKFNLIQSRIDDTMIDMMIGVIGTLAYVASIALFFRKRLLRTKN